MFYLTVGKRLRLRFVSRFALCGWFVVNVSLAFAAQSAATFPEREPPAMATVYGRVAGKDDHALAGVSVLLRMPTGRQISIRSDASGHFETTLEAGDYQIWLRRRGYVPIAARSLSLHLGENRIRYVLRPQPKGSTVTSLFAALFPANQSPQVKPNSTTEAANDSLQNLPRVSETLLDRYGEIRTPGSQVTSSKYLVDRPYQSKPQEFGLASPLNAESMQSLELSASKSGTVGAGAEYTPASKGLSLEPRPGGDHSSWDLKNLFPPLQFQRGLHLGNWRPQVTWAGPLRSERAWFSDTISAEHDLVIVPELPRRQDSVSAWEGSNLIRTQFNLSSNHLVNLSFLSSLRDDTHIGLSAFTPLSTTVDLGSRRLRFSANDQHAVGKTVFEEGITLESLRSTLTPQGGTPYILFPGSSQGNYFETLHGDTRQGQIFGNVLVPTQSRLGNHDLQFGADLTPTRFEHHAWRTPFQIRREDGTLEQVTSFVGDSDFFLHNARIGSYIQDTWKLTSRVRIQSGLHLDWDRIIRRYEPAPRFSVVYSPFANHRTKLFAFWGYYYPPLNLALLGQAVDQLRIDRFYDSGGHPTGAPQTVDFVANFPRLKAPSVTISRTGWEQQIGGHSFVGVSMLWRTQRDGLAYYKLAAHRNEEDLALFNDRRDRYRAVEFSFRQSFGSRAEFLAGYTRSHATTNQLFDYDPASAAFTNQYQGPLEWDAPNRLVSWAWAPVKPGNLMLSYLLEYRTGFPFTVFDETYQVVGQPNLLRFPDVFRLNLGIEKLFNVGGRSVGIQLACLNLTNHNNPTVVDNNTASPDFLRFAGSTGRGFTGRVRFIGKP